MYVVKYLQKIYVMACEIWVLHINSCKKGKKGNGVELA